MEKTSVLEQLTLEEKARLLCGVGSWHTYSCNGKLPVIMMTDGPHGLRKQVNEDFSDINRSEIATCFPTASAMASSWNLTAVEKLAAAIGREALKEQVSVVLGCGVNIKRSPLCGRNFEYFSEDPFLSGKLATAYITSMQKLGVGTSLKHFAGNNQETRRQTSNSQIDERALREIYLTAFEMTVKEAQPTTIMASYNRLNGEYACANRHLLTDILRNEWGFQGAVISDWGAAIDVVKCIKAGMDLEMPDSLSIHTKQILAAVHSGQISVAELDRAVEKVIALVMEQKEKIKEATVDYDKHHTIARELEGESAVLLKNDGVLPLTKKSKVLVVGELAEHMRFQGGGSSHITTVETPNAIQSLRAKGIEVIYAQGYNNYGDKIDGKLEQEAIALAKDQMPVLFFGGLTDSFEGEGYDRKTMGIPSCQRNLLEQIYKINTNIVFIAFGGSPMEMPFVDKVRAILYMHLGGQAVGEACADLIVGDVNPSGKLAETFPVFLKDIPCSKFFAPDSDDVEYRESIFVGYRYYDTFHKPTLFSFGHGLSYTKFEYDNMKLSDSVFSVFSVFEEGDFSVSFTIRNVGARKGSEIAQVYVENPECNYLRANKELSGFAKVELEAGESKTVTVMLNNRSFSIYDVDRESFIVPSGKYQVLVGASVSDIKLSAQVEVTGVDYNKDERQRLSQYFALDKEDGFQISREDFAVLYNKPLSKFDAIKKGEYTIYHSLNTLSKKSLLAKLTLKVTKLILYKMNKGKPKDDPAVKMIIQGLSEGPLDCVVCGSNGLFPPKLAKAIVHAANGHLFKPNAK